MMALGVTGDGDTASIGIGQFMHLMRRNLPMIYIIEDNGVYGLTKGQFSATADLGSKLKTGVINDLPPFDSCALAIHAGRDVRWPIVFRRQEAVAHHAEGRAVASRHRDLDVISPCITFNDHEGSTKSYKYVKDHEEPLHELNFVPHFKEIDVEYDEGTALNVTMHDGSTLLLRKLEDDYDPTNKTEAIKRVMQSHEAGEVLTGVLYLNTTAPNFLDMINMTDQPLATLPESATRPSREALEECMEELR